MHQGIYLNQHVITFSRGKKLLKIITESGEGNTAPSWQRDMSLGPVHDAGGQHVSADDAPDPSAYPECSSQTWFWYKEIWSHHPGFRDWYWQFLMFYLYDTCAHKNYVFCSLTCFSQGLIIVIIPAGDGPTGRWLQDIVLAYAWLGPVC